MARIDDIISYAHESDVAAIVTDRAIRATYVNDAFTRLCGYAREDLIGKKPGDLLRGEGSDEESRQRFRAGIRELVPFDVKVVNYRKDTGEEYLVGIYVLPVRDDQDPEESYFVALQRELASPYEEILLDTHFSKALFAVMELVNLDRG